MKGETIVMSKKMLGLCIFLLILGCPAYSGVITTPEMSLILPVPGTVAGPSWAQMLNSAFQTIDTHDHTLGNGVQIPSSGLNINQDLQFGNYNLVNPRSIMFTNQSAALFTSNDKNNVYVVNGNLYFNNASGTPIQLTSGTSVNVGGVGSITGMGGTTAAVTYLNSLKTFTFTQSSGITADIGAGSYSLFENVTGANPITLKSPVSVGASFTITMPSALPTVSSVVTMDTTGKLGTTNANALVPSGVLMPFAGATAPSGFLMCDGSAISRTQYAALFAAIGTTYGAGDGSTTFNLPNMLGNVPMGKNGSYPLGTVGGEATHVLTVNEMPSHSHTDSGHLHNYNESQSGGGGADGGSGNGSLYGGTHNQTTTTGNANIQNTGGGAAHNNLQPFVTFNYIIKS